MGRRLIVEADGGSRGNPGPAGYGALVKDARTGEVLAEIGEAIGTATNNVAEYRGLVAGLTAAAKIDPDCTVEVRMDSKLVVEQMSGRWQVKHEDMRTLVKQARAVLSPSQVLYTWVPRARNAHADRLANEAMDDAAHGRPWRGSSVAPPAVEPALAEPVDEADRFGAREAEWARWQQSPWGRLRYRVVAHVLNELARQRQAALGRSRLRVLDVGGADGSDAVPLALAGHDVTVLDTSPGLLRQARERARREGVTLRLVQADLDGLGRPGPAEALPVAGYDLVLCHFVVQYRTDLAATVRQVCAMAGPGGAVSLAGPNPPSDVLLAVIREQDPAAALQVLDAATVPSVTFGAPMARVSAERVAELLRGNGFGEPRRYGIRCVSDYLTDDEAKEQPEVYAALERLELALHDREPFAATARMWQLVAVRG